MHHIQCVRVINNQFELLVILFEASFRDKLNS